ncbi:nuclear transport factor 2 family protein [Pseudonocardia xishanensis]|uniref:SnoaL-like domain-containing protein n=1 Tax=Pseudonocardia xishanensis TaxID=630995 RepID=A0ABP8S1K0_9PSEU
MTDTTALFPAPAWVRAAGRVTPSGPRPAGGPEVAAERQAAVDTLHRFAWAFDEHDRDRLEDCFDPDAVWTATIGGHRDLGRSEGREAVLTWLTAGWPAQADQRRHIVTNAVVDGLDAGSDEATVTAMIFVTAAQDGGFRAVTAGVYRTRVRRGGDGSWRITRFDASFDAPF